MEPSNTEMATVVRTYLIMLINKTWMRQGYNDSMSCCFNFEASRDAMVLLQARVNLQLF